MFSIQLLLPLKCTNLYCLFDADLLFSKTNKAYLQGLFKDSLKFGKNLCYPS